MELSDFFNWGHPEYTCSLSGSSWAQPISVQRDDPLFLYILYSEQPVNTEPFVAQA